MDFTGELRRLDLLVHREILRLRAAYQLSLDELRGVYISDERVDALIAETRPPGAADGVPELTHAADELRARLASPDASPLAALVHRLDLTPFQRDAVMVALAPELHVRYETLFGYLNNAAARRHATVDLILRLCGGGADERAQLGAGARLLRDGLLEPIDPPSERRPELARELAAAPALVAALLGPTPFDARLSACVAPAADRRGAQVALPETVESALVQLAHLGPLAERPLVVLLADAGQAPEAAALRLARRWERGLLRIFGSAWPADAWAPTALSLTAQLRGDAVFLDLEEWNGDARRLLTPLISALTRTRVPIIVAAAPATDWRALLREPALTLRLPELDVAARRALWARVLPPDVPARALSDVAEHFRLGAAQIDDAARMLTFAEADAEAEADARRRLFAAARSQSSGDLGHLAQLVPQRHAWSDLVLPSTVMRRLRDVSGAVAARARVFGDWGFGRRSGSGLMVLFAGSSGTGKTMSAAVIAREIGLELYRIELASVVSKYIGETEKNLHRIFEGAHRANVMLFFDEADALLGRRSEVKDAHDRYANIEVAYLLQKMEEHDGVIILASNLAKNMDQAFARRMHYVVEFPRPDAPLRERLWRTILPPEAPRAADLDFGFLARQFDLAGGDIKTVALDAAFVAAGEHRPVAMADLVGAVSRQMLKQGRPTSAGDFKHYHHLLAEGSNGANGR
jgi:hypothetical protein